MLDGLALTALARMLLCLSVLSLIHFSFLLCAFFPLFVVQLCLPLFFFPKLIPSAGQCNPYSFVLCLRINLFLICLVANLLLSSSEIHQTRQTSVPQPPFHIYAQLTLNMMGRS